MSVLLVLFSMMVALGLVVAARGLVPVHPSLREQLDYFASSTSSGRGRAVDAPNEKLSGMLAALQGSKKRKFFANLAVVGRTEREHINEILKGAAGAALVLLMVFWIFAGVSLLAIVLAILLGLPVGYLLVDSELTKKAKKRRSEFEETLVSVLSLMSVSMAGGSGLNTAIRHTLGLGEGWVIETLVRSVDEAEFRKETPWDSLERLGDVMMIPSLVELSATLSLVGTSGARVSQTLAARADSARAKQLSEQRSEAAAKSGSMGIPLGLMMFAWVCFLAYPAIAQLISL